MTFQAPEAAQVHLSDTQAAADESTNEPFIPKAIHASDQPVASAPAPATASPAPDTSLPAPTVSIPDQTQTTDAEERKPHLAPTSQPPGPDQVEVVCADTHATLKLDFDQMRCIILYKGTGQAVQPQTLAVNVVNFLAEHLHDSQGKK